jgi:hypothetical protein
MRQLLNGLPSAPIHQYSFITMRLQPTPSAGGPPAEVVWRRAR